VFLANGWTTLRRRLEWDNRLIDNYRMSKFEQRRIIQLDGLASLQRSELDTIVK